MMQLVFGLVLLVLAGGMVLLFAMLGELASRVPESSQGAGDQTVRPLEGARIGRAPSSWPAGLSDLAAARSGLLLVLSTACGSCQQVARQLSSVVGRDEADEIAILVSSPSRDRGEDFVQQHGLARFPYFVDEGGDWVQDEFGVMMSPTGLVMREGRLDAAMVFQDVAALRAAALSAPTGFEEKDDESSEGIDPDGSTQRFGTPPARRPGDERPLRSDDAVRPLHPG